MADGVRSPAGPGPAGGGAGRGSASDRPLHAHAGPGPACQADLARASTLGPAPCWKPTRTASTPRSPNSAVVLPPEFLLLRHRPEPWRPADTLRLAKLMAFDLSTQLARGVAACAAGPKLRPDQMADLWPGRRPRRPGDVGWAGRPVARFTGRGSSARHRRRASAPMSGSPPARGPRAACRCSPTTRIWRCSCPGIGISPISKRRNWP